MFEDVLRFWLDRGVDGFRVDVAHSLYKESVLRDQVKEPGDDGKRASSAVAGEGGMIEWKSKDEPMWDQPEVHDVYRAWRKILDSYEPARMSVAEAWTQTPESTARYVRPDELHQAFNFAWLLAPWSAASFREVIDGTLAAIELVDSSPTWVLSNHDVTRHLTRYGGGPVGLARARAATLTMLALPGSSYLYQGEELGLPEVDVAPEFRQDPSWLRTGEVGRDGCRVPIPWSGDAAPYGFGPGAEQPWLPQPDYFARAHRGEAAGRPVVDAGVLPRRPGRPARPGRGRRRRDLRRGGDRRRAVVRPRPGHGPRQLREEAGPAARRRGRRLQRRRSSTACCRSTPPPGCAPADSLTRRFVERCRRARTSGVRRVGPSTTRRLATRFA